MDGHWFERIEGETSGRSGEPLSHVTFLFFPLSSQLLFKHECLYMTKSKAKHRQITLSGNAQQVDVRRSLGQGRSIHLVFIISNG